MIYTFYSYKGGVGRTMALANVAELFYQAGLKVLMVDWDLEAPGLERFFPIETNKVLGYPGVMDMLLDYKQRMAQPPEKGEGVGELALPLPLDEIGLYPLDVYPGERGKGRLWLLPAGKRVGEHFARYASLVRTFDWQDFYQNWEGELFFEWLRQQFKQMADVVLIDSRTGVTEMGGVCVYQLADTAAMFCAPHRQSLEGTHKMAQNFKDPQVQKLRRGRLLNVLIIPARIERAEGDLLDEFQKEFMNRFTDFVPQITGIDIARLWQLGIPYIPKYAYEETVAVRESGLASAEDMSTAFRGLMHVLDRLRLSQLAHAQPGVAAHQLALAFSRLEYPKDRTELARIASLVEALAEPLAEYRPLLIYARSMASLARDDAESAMGQLRDAFGKQSQIQVTGVNLSIPVSTLPKGRPRRTERSGTITWLHLSDIHLNRDRFDQSVHVLATLWQDLKMQVKERQPDFIVVTGDIAHSGAWAEYEIAAQYFFDPLLQVTELTQDRLFLVPGNHDVRWDMVRMLRPDITTQLDSRDKVFDLLTDASLREPLFIPMDGYRRFVLEYFNDWRNSIAQDPLYGYVQIMELRGVSVAVVGLNSAWLSGHTRYRDGEVADRGNLLVGEAQVQKALEAEGFAEASIRIALMHHPFAWLKEFDALHVSRVLREHCNFILRGHMHEPSILEETAWYDKQVHIIPCGATLQTELLRSGYNLVRLNLDSAVGTIWLRTYHDRYQRWEKDVEATGDAADGRVDFQIAL